MEVYKTYIGETQFLVIDTGDQETVAIPLAKIMHISTYNEEDYPLQIETVDGNFQFDQDAADSYLQYIRSTKG